MIYITVFYEFLKIGAFAIGGGLVTVPFLFELSEKFGWFTPQELANMYAVAQSLPGPIGINLGVYAGYTTAGVLGGIIAAIGLVTVPIIVIMVLSNYLHKNYNSKIVKNSLYGIRPATIALIAFATFGIAKLSVTDAKTAIMFGISILIMRWAQRRIITFVILSALAGIIFEM